MYSACLLALFVKYLHMHVVLGLRKLIIDASSRKDAITIWSILPQLAREFGQPRRDTARSLCRKYLMVLALLLRLLNMWIFEQTVTATGLD